jgi:CubicO group peptidase (beta-lactamase class C family)
MITTRFSIDSISTTRHLLSSSRGRPTRGIKNRAFFACLLLSLTVIRASAFETSQPEAQGVPSRAILGLVEAVERDVDALHSFVLLRHGKLIAEGWWVPYEKDRPHMLYSLSKSFTSTAVGIAVDEGKLGLDDKVVSFFPGKVPAEPGKHLRTMRVRDLLCMGSGHHHDTLGPMKDDADPDWIKTFLAQPVRHRPGTHFRYNTGATYMLSAILQKVTGEKLLDYLTPRLFEPLGIRDATWETSPQGIQTGGYGLKIKTRDIARLGQLYLQKGTWNDRRLLSGKWVEQATSKQIANGKNPNSDWNQGYGFQFWRCRHNAYRGDGAFGQYCIVMPDQDAVLAITGGLGNLQKVLDLVWVHLLPAMRPQPVPPRRAARNRLSERLSSLTLTPVRGEHTSVVAEKVLGKWYALASNEKGLEAVSLRRDRVGVFLLLDNAHGRQRIDCGHGCWSKGEMTFEKDLTPPVAAANGLQPIAASGAWTAPDRYLARLYFYETPYRLDLDLRFEGSRVDLNLEYNVAFGQKKWRFAGKETANR